MFLVSGKTVGKWKKVKILDFGSFLVIGKWKRKRIYYMSCWSYYLKWAEVRVQLWETQLEKIEVLLLWILALLVREKL